MFCFQCQQTAGGKGCTASGVCGKSAEVADIQDEIVARAIDFAATPAAREKKGARMIIDALFTTLTNVNFDGPALKKIADSFGVAPSMDMSKIWSADEDIRSLKSLILFGLKGMAAYAHHAAVLGYEDDEVDASFPRALRALAETDDAAALLDLALEIGKLNVKCLELLDRANTESYGSPAPRAVTSEIEPGPFVVVTGHDLRDLRLLLEAAEKRGINVYTHGEMLPAHGYPELNKFKCLRGNIGTAWQNQRSELDAIPAPVLFTTNCLMPPKPSYADRVFTTSIVGWPGAHRIGDDKDFTPLLDMAEKLGGYKERKSMPGVNGGSTVTTGFGHAAVLANAGKIIDAVKAGAIKHFFLVAGCDAPGKNREYYTEFVKNTPKDTIVLTLACGKFRFNDLDIGEIGGLPRIIDMGQCNDAYSAVKVALALADAFGCGVNELPLSLNISWYEQKAAVILLSLLHLGIKDIYLGPTLPAFVSPNILKALVEKWNVSPISTPEEDLKKMLA